MFGTGYEHRDPRVPTEYTEMNKCNDVKTYGTRLVRLIEALLYISATY